MNNVATLAIKSRELDLAGLEGDELWGAAHEFVKDEVKRLNGQVDDLMSRAMELDEIDFDDPRLRQRVQAEAGLLTSDRLQCLLTEVTKPERDRAARERAVWSKTWEKSASLRYFTITNARRNTVHILADDAEVARYIAFSNDRITKKTHGNLRPYDTVSIEKLSYGRGIEAALADGWPGEVEIMGDKVIHKGRKQVYG